MNQPKLTPAQQRVFDWLGESPERCLKDTSRRQFIAYATAIQTGPRRVELVTVDFRPTVATLRALVRSQSLAFRIVWSHKVWVHPKFTGGTDGTEQ